MRNDQYLEQLLVETGAFRDLENPVILTSGELSIYYINTEKICPDGGKWEKFGHDPFGMIYHSIIMAKEHPSFQGVIDRLSEGVNSLFPITSKQPLAVSGGQRRDWLFSGPVAVRVGEQGVPHLSLYQQEEGKKDRINAIYPDGSIDDNPSLEGWQIIHVADIITTGSSAYRKENGKEKGWIPRLKERGASIEHLVTVVSREQGGELLLAKQGVITHSLISIDERFLKTYSTNPKMALRYKKDQQGWAEEYLIKNGTTRFADYFDPQGGKQERAYKFLKRYEMVLKQSQGQKELEEVVWKKYRIRFK